MTKLPSQSAYKPTAIALHWLMGLVLAVTFALGLYMADMPLSPDKLRYYSWHKWIGVSLFMLAAVRLAVRLTSPHTLAGGSRSLQESLALWAHRILYLLMFAIPLSGWLMSSAKGVPTVYLGLWQLPDLVGRNAVLGRSLQTLHVTLNFTMAVIVIGHVAAALKHHFVDHDGVLARMLPCVEPRSSGKPS
ncbi:cytochrome b [Uliginosibacterium sp. H3]|uniref:Cytochrome b n=1 Tax=Uliginosibacterium silvisoli TaxID=3114758 RepID=A0ABU6K7F4_9RHOO|nr:cytochrome b [Uliginosibacterium sp. H3]